MSIQQLVDQIDVVNIAEDLDEEVLRTLGSDVITRFDQDWGSMKDWREAVDFGLELVKQELHPKSTPWQGAANFKSPILTEAALAFGDRASLELLRARDLVKADVIGKDDDQGTKKNRAERVMEDMNYQINYKMKEWRPDQKRMLYTLPNIGSMFKKVIFDPLLGRNKSHIIHYPNFAINQATTELDSARSFTDILDRSKNDVIVNQRAGLWLDVDLYAEDSKGDTGSNEKEDVQDAVDNPNAFLEQYCFADLDDDGYDEPYIVTVHQQSKKVVRVVARYDIESIVVTDDTDKVFSLGKVMDEQRTEQQAFEQSLNIEEQETKNDFKAFDLVRIDPNQPIVQYGFIPSQDGTFLNLGYFHILGGVTMGVNTTTNQLLDAGTLANRQSGLMAKGMRKKMGPLLFRPGEFKSTEVPAAQLKDSILPLPIKEPSATLMLLNEKLDASGRRFAAATDASGAIQPNTAPTTALAIIQEQLLPMSALMGRIIDAMSQEFQKLFKLNKSFSDTEEYRKLLDDPQADPEADYTAEGLDIIPTANSEMSSKMQRIQLAEVQMSMFDRVLQAQGNPIPLVKFFFDAIGSEINDQIFPEEGQMSKEDRQALDALKAQTEQQNKLLEQQNQIAELQAQLFKREVDRKDFEAQTKAKKTDSDILSDEVERENTEADTDKKDAETVKILRETSQPEGDS